MKKRCGDFGGKRSDGEPCGRVVKDGPCHVHNAEADAERAALKARFLEEYSKSLVKLDAATACGTSVVTMWRIRQEDPEFAAQIAAIDDAAEELRYERAEDSGWKRVFDGNAPASLHMFYLVNASRRRGDGRWKHVHHIQQSNIPVDPADMTEEELQRVAAGEDPIAVFAETRGRRRQPDDEEDVA